MIKPDLYAFDAVPWSLQFQVFGSCQLADTLIQVTYKRIAVGAGIKDTQHAQGHWLIRIQTKNPSLPSQVSKTAQLLIVYPNVARPRWEIWLSPSSFHFILRRSKASGAQCRKANIIPLIFDVISTHRPHQERHASQTADEQQETGGIIPFSHRL